VIPSTVTGVLAFLASVGPGYVYVRIRETWRPQFERTPLREAAQMVVAGSLATLVGVVVAANLADQWGFLNLTQLVQHFRSYVAMNPEDIALALGIVVVVSYGLAALVGRFAPGRGGRVVPDSGWYAAFERMLPANHGIKATVELLDGRKISGIIQAFTAEQGPVDERELTLVKSNDAAMSVESPGGGPVATLAEDFVVLRGSDIRYVAASFVAAEPTPTRGRLKRAWAYGRLAVYELRRP
jgi:Family of unknown function (DUF6338)